jgi:hypothetical protein
MKRYHCVIVRLSDEQRLRRSELSTPTHGGYVVLQQVRGAEWRLIGEVDRRPGLPARKSRGQAVRDVIGREVEDGEVFAVLPRSEWRNGLDH